MSIDDIQARLAATDAAFKTASTDTGFENFMPEPGDYFTKFREVDFFVSNKTDAAFLKISLEVLQEKDYEGKVIEMIYNLEPHKVAPGAPALSEEDVAKKHSWLKRDLERLGVNVADISLSAVAPGSPLWDDLIGKVVDVDVRQSKTINQNTGKPYVNAYIKGISGATLGDLGEQTIPGLPDRQVGDEPAPWDDDFDSPDPEPVTVDAGAKPEDEIKL